MNWYYAEGDRQVGPIDEAALDDLVRSGVIRDETLVWHDGMAGWQPLNTVRAKSAAPPVPANVPTGYCSECGRPFPLNQLEAIGNAAVCAECKPNYQRAALPPPPAAAAYTASASALPPGPGQYATWANRVIGYLIDTVFVMVACWILYAVIFGIFGGALGIGRVLSLSDATSGLGALTGGIGSLGCCCSLAIFPLATLLVGLYNRVYLVSQRGYSIGQGVMKIKIVDAQGRLLSQSTALIRLLAQAGLSFVPVVGPLLDLLWPLWDPQRQTLHDKAVGSFAINNPGGR
jgi:uncharacterized RDD family membrane protein YckC